MVKVMCAGLAEHFIAKIALRDARPVRRRELPAQVAAVLLNISPDNYMGKTKQPQIALSRFLGPRMKPGSIEASRTVTPLIAGC